MANKKSKVIIEKIVSEKKTAKDFIKKIHPTLLEVRLENTTPNSPAKQIKRPLVDFKPGQTSWLEKYPMIQKEVKQIIEKYKKEIKKSAEDLFQEFPNSVLLPYKLYIEEVKEFKPNNPDILSVRMIVYTYTGGAHGRKSYYSWNWNKQKKFFLSLDEVITSEQFATLVKHTRDMLFEQQKKGNKYDKHRKTHIQRGVSKKKISKYGILTGMELYLFFPNIR